MSSSDPTSTENPAASELEHAPSVRTDADKAPDDSLEIVLSDASESAGEAEPVTVDMSADDQPAPAQPAQPSIEGTPLPVLIDDDDDEPMAAQAEAPRTETSSLVDGPPPTPPRDPAPEDYSDAVASAISASLGDKAPEPTAVLQESATEVVAAEAEASEERPSFSQEATTAHGEEHELDADAIMESSDPTPGPDAIAAAGLGGRAPLPPPTDEELLHNVVLPPGVRGATATPTPVIGDADRTVISAMPPVVEPEPFVAPYPPLSWATTPVRKTEIISRPTLQARTTPSFGQRLLSVAGKRVQTSVAQLGIVVLAASVLGGAAVKALDRGVPDEAAMPRKLVLPQSSKVRVDVATAPRPPEIAPLPPHVDEAPEATPRPVVTIEPTPRRAAKVKPKPAAPPVAPATEVAAVEAPKPTPVVKKAAAPSKPRTRRVAQHTDWVDPFGQ
jgi:hypothetical protein